MASSPALSYLGIQLLVKKSPKSKKNWLPKGFTKFAEEDFDTFENYFNEDNWFILQTEFDEVVKFEIGAIINAKDEFDWKFKK